MGQIYKVGIMGAGAWGTALGLTAERAGSQVTLWDPNKTLINEISSTCQHPALPEADLRKSSLNFTSEIENLKDADILLLVTPFSVIRSVCKTIAPLLHKKTVLGLASKGIENQTGKLGTEIIKEELGCESFVISGPNFAVEVSRDLPTATIAASTSNETRRHVSNAFTHENFKVLTTSDSIGVQLAGSLKNIVAIGCGILLGKELGENARATFISKALSELIALGKVKGAKEETFYGLAGIGDLILTSMGTLSRNLRFGKALAEGFTPDAFFKETGLTVEGYYTAASAKVLMESLGLKLQALHTVYEILYENKDINKSINTLLFGNTSEEKS